MITCTWKSCSPCQSSVDYYGNTERQTQHAQKKCQNIINLLIVATIMWNKQKKKKKKNE